MYGSSVSINGTEYLRPTSFLFRILHTPNKRSTSRPTSSARYYKHKIIHSKTTPKTMHPHLTLRRSSFFLALFLAILTILTITSATPDSCASQTSITPTIIPFTTAAPKVAERQATVPFQPAICIAGPACTVTAGVPMNPAAVKSDAGGSEKVLFGVWTGFWYGVFLTALWISALHIGAWVVGWSRGQPEV